MPTVLMPNGNQVWEDRDYHSYLARFDVLDRNETWGSAHWAGAGSLGETLDIARRGWPEGEAYVRDVALPAVSAAQGIASGPTWGYDVTGASYDVGEYLSGVPECWLSPSCEETKPVIRMIVNITSSAYVGADTIRMRGAAVAALALRLQSAGYAIELWAAWGVDAWGAGKHWHRVLLSDSQGGPLDTGRVLFGLAHPAAGRQLGHFITSSGIPIDNPPWSADLYLPCMHIQAADWSSVEAVTKWIETTYTQVTKQEDL